MKVKFLQMFHQRKRKNAEESVRIILIVNVYHIFGQEKNKNVYHIFGRWEYVFAKVSRIRVRMPMKLRCHIICSAIYLYLYNRVFYH